MITITITYGALAWIVGIVALLNYKRIKGWFIK